MEIEEEEDEISEVDEEEDEVEDSGEDLGGRSGTQASRRTAKRGRTTASALKVTPAHTCEHCQADFPTLILSTCHSSASTGW